MVDPVLISVFNKRKKFLFRPPVHTEENTQAGLGEDYVRRRKKDVIAGNSPI
jgi:hypothetical protein